LLSRVAVPIALPPSKNVTVPVGVAEALDTEAVRWTVWPSTGEATSVVRDVVVAATELVPPRLYLPI